MKKNILTIHTIMNNVVNSAIMAKKNVMKYLCVVLLLIGTSASAWATDVTSVSSITSGNEYRIKAVKNGTRYLKVIPTTNNTAVRHAAVSDAKEATIFQFTKKSGNSWYISFYYGTTKWYLVVTGSESNGYVTPTTSQTAVTMVDYTSYGEARFKISNDASSGWLMLSDTYFGKYSSTTNASPYLETASSITLKIPNGDGTYTTWPGCSQGDMTYQNATGIMNCSYGTNYNYTNRWITYTIADNSPVAVGSLPAKVDHENGTATGGATYYPVWAYSNLYRTEGVRCAVPQVYVYYNKNTTDAVTNMPSDATVYTSGDEVTVKNNIPVRSGYTFLGWSEDSEATSKDDKYDPGDSFTMPSSNVNLYAVWCKDMSTVSAYDLTSSNLTSTGLTISWSAVTGATKYELRIYDSNANLLDGYDFTNLTSTTKTISGLTPNTSYYAEVLAENDCGATYTASKLLEFTTLRRYTITYDANGGTGTTPSTQYRDHGAAAVTLSDGSGLSKSGYTLSRWDTNSSGAGESHAKGESYSTNADLALFAVWAPAIYTITYKDQGGASFSGSHVDSPTAHPTTHTYGSATTLNSATKTGYTFDGWFTTAGCTDGSDVISLSATTYTDNITLYAKWSPVTINLVLDANTAHGGSTGGSGSILFGSSNATISTAAVGTSGNYLLGYYDAATDGHKILETNGALAASNVDNYITDSKWSRATSTTLYAQYGLSVYEVSFEMHDHGSELGSQNVAHGGTVTEPTPAPSDPNWRFDGWFKDNGSGGISSTPFNFSEQITGTTTIHAKWTERSYNHLIFGCVDIDLDTEDSDPILVTGRNGVNIMATKKLVVNTTNAVNGHRISFSGTDLKFYKNDGTRFVELTGSNSLTVTGSEQEVYVSYNPTSAGDNAIATPTITVACDGFSKMFDDLVRARNLPASMVIATKVGGSWYALPATMPGARAVQSGVLVTVDETNKIAYGPTTLAYKIWPVTTVNSTNDRFGTATGYIPDALYGDRVRFAGNDDDGLNTSNTENTLNLLTDITGANSVTGAPYEWKIVTSDLDAYTLQTDNGENTNYLDVYRPSSGNHAYKVVWATNDSYLSNEIHFFKLEEITSIDIIPREWKANGLVFAIAADDDISLEDGDAQYGIGEAATNDATLTRHSTGGYGLYEVALPDLTSHYGKALTLKLKIKSSDSFKYATTTIPIIVNANKSTKDDAPFSTLGLASQDYDVVVLRGKTLTTDAQSSGAYKFQNMYLYAGSTLVNTANGNLNLRYLELRGGIIGIDAKESLVTDVPHLMLGKKIAACPGGANLDMYVNTTHAYALSVPFTVNLANVNFANSLNTSTGAPINGTLNNQFMIMQYSATERINSGKGWQRITSTETDLTAGRGYVLEAKRPKGQPFAVIRFPLSLGTAVQHWADNENGEVEKSAVVLSDAGIGDTDVSDNNRAWNLLANPYMANISYKEHDESAFVASFTVGKLVESDTYPRDGKYVYEKDEGSYRAYVAIPNEDFTEYPQSRANAVTFEPFKNFFVQASTAGNVSFERSYRTPVAAAPSRIVANFEKPAYVDINLTYGTKMAQAGLTIDANATAGYKYGEDQNIFENRDELNYLKVYTIVDGHYLVGNTLRPDEISQLIPVEFYAPGEEGDYVFSLDEGSEADDFEQIILYDDQLNKQTNLMLSDYKFTISAKGLVENRFFLNMTPKQETPPTPTSMEEIQGDTTLDAPLKFIYQDKMYILYHGVIYDAVGKRVSIIKR